MRAVKLAGACSATIALALALSKSSSPSAAGTPAKGPEVLTQARAVLETHCLKCHGNDPKKLKAKLNLLDRKYLLDKKIVVPDRPGDSKLIQRVRTDDATEQMPPDKPKLSQADAEILERWIKDGAPDLRAAKPAAAAAPAGGKNARPASPPADEVTDLAARVKELFRTRCGECHANGSSAGGVEVDNHAQLLKDKTVVPNNPEKSPLYLRITGKKRPVMPEEPRPELSRDDQELVRRWIQAGAPAFPEGPPKPEQDKDQEEWAKSKHIKGVDHVLKSIKEHVGKLRRGDVPYVRYFSINHLLAAGADRSRLQAERDALAKAINHLSWEPRLVKPEAIDPPYDTVYAVNLKDLGWDRQPYRIMKDDKAGEKSRVNLFDLALLEYPFAIAYSDSDTMGWLLEHYVKPSGMARPVAYVRADWFVSVATQAPLYNDFLQLPTTLAELEKRLDVDSADNVAKAKAKRGAVVKSGVSQNNRVVERHPSSLGGYYWKSFDFRSSKGAENIFRNPIKLKPAGGEMIFSLPNGLQGYFVVNATGNRVDSAPTEVVVDKFARDKVVRNGLSCIRCHERGMIRFKDVMRPALLKLQDDAPLFDKEEALELYPEQKVLQDYVKEDEGQFTRALAALLKDVPKSEPLAEVTKYYEYPIDVVKAADELGYKDVDYLAKTLRLGKLTPLGLMPLGGGDERGEKKTREGLIPRDAWEDYYPQVVTVLGLGNPVVPLDAMTRRDFPGTPALNVAFWTNHDNKADVYHAGDKMVLYVANNTKLIEPIYIELVWSNSKGEMEILTPEVVEVKPGKENAYQFPPDRKQAIKMVGGQGKEWYTLYASTRKFEGGQLLRYAAKEKGKGMGDRVYHPSLYKIDLDGKKVRMVPTPTVMVKKTIEIETR